MSSLNSKSFSSSSHSPSDALPPTPSRSNFRIALLVGLFFASCLIYPTSIFHPQLFFSSTHSPQPVVPQRNALLNVQQTLAQSPPLTQSDSDYRILFKSPELNRFLWHSNFTSDLSPSSGKRLIAVGDVHGMVNSLKLLLHSAGHDPRSDTVVLVGDLAAKHPSIEASLETIRFCRQAGFMAVRGNHDQYIIIWRNWMLRHRAIFVGGPARDRYDSDHEATLEGDEWLEADQPDDSLLPELPSTLKWKSKHFEIARRLPKSDFNWLLSLSLTLYCDPLKTFFVHAGLLPWKRGNLESGRKAFPNIPITSVKENNEPFTLIEMRTVKKGRKPSKGSKGKAWYKLWNKTMKKCAKRGTDAYHVIYGHWAAKGLKIKDFSVGLDGGCVYGRRLSALVIGDAELGLEKSRIVDQFQINGHNASVVQISCPTP